MPELPEVETIRRSLASRLTGKTIVEVKVLEPVVIKFPEPEAFAHMLAGRRIESLSRRGKYLIFNLDHDLQLIAHFRMTGHFLITDSAVPLDKHCRVLFVLDDNMYLSFVEPRKFGTLHLISAGCYEQAGGIAALGEEPISEYFNADYLKRQMGKKHGKIKALLLDQKLVAGIGNIYADEILHAAAIDPQRDPSGMSDEEFERLAAEAREIISTAIECRGSTIRDYCDADGESGSYQDHHQVYGREGEVCPRCGGIIRRIKIGGRSSHYCPDCQK